MARLLFLALAVVALASLAISTPVDTDSGHQTQVGSANLNACVGQPDGRLVAYSNSRVVYFQCFQGRIHQFQCSAGLVFSERAQACVFQE